MNNAIRVWIREYLQDNKLSLCIEDNAYNNNRDITNCVRMEIANSRFKTLNTIKIMIASIHTSALVDTGATCSLVNYEFYQQIKEIHSNVNLDIIGAENIRMHTADNKLLRIRGRYDKNVWLSPSSYVYYVLCC